MAYQHFKLSSAGRLATIIAISFVACSSFAGNIVPDGGALGPGVATAPSGAQVVNIVTPTDRGLSHNQYQDFNVNRPGAVFNNALTGGESQLAGALAANPNLHGQSASVILNEVISRNPSLLLGQQEVFGMAADYVLANPNGITCDGCGFINTTRSALVVGNPLVEGGALSAYSTLNNDNRLQIGTGGLSTNSVLDLVAPRIESVGAVSAREINAVSGNNRLTRDLRQIDAGVNGTALDSYYLGSMQAGRIRIINTAAGSGVKLAGTLHADQDISVAAKDRLTLQSAELRGGDISLQASTLRAEGTLSQRDEQREGKDNYQNYRGGINVSDSRREQSYRRTVLSGKNLTLVAAQSTHLTATDISGDDVTIAGGEVLLDGASLTQEQKQIDNRWFYSWQHDETRSDSQQRAVAGRIDARHNASLSATHGDLRLQGSEVSAGHDLRLKAKGDVALSGIQERDEHQLTGYKRNEGAALNSGRWSQRSSEERLHQTRLRAGHDLSLEAGGDLSAQAAQIRADNDAGIAAAGKVNLTVQNVANRKTEIDNHTYWGGIGGGGERDNNHSQERSQASEVESGGQLTISAGQDVTISGSRAHGGRGGVVQSQRGDVIIDRVVNTTHEQDNSRRGGAFNITTASEKRTESHDQVRGSQLASDVNLRVESARDIQVNGSRVESDGKLALQAGGRVDVAAAAGVDTLEKESTSLQVTAYAKAQGDKQYRAGVGIEHTAQQEESRSVTHRGSQLRGGSVEVTAGDDVVFSGAHLQADAGDAQISGKNVAFVSAEESKTSHTRQTQAGGGAYYTAGIDKAGSGYEGHYSHSDTQNEQVRAQGSSSSVSGNLTITATDKLTQQGAHHQAGGVYREQAASVEHLEANNRDSSRSQRTQVHGEAGVSVDYSAVTRPLEGAVKKGASLDANGVVNEIGTIGKPNLGIDVAADGGTHTQSSSDTQAQTTQIQAGAIQVTARDEVHDRGTQYRATDGGVSLRADSHRFDAASDSHRGQTDDVNGGASLRVYTTTGKDIGGAARGQGENRSGQAQSVTAQAGKVQAANGIDIQLGQEGRYQGTALDGGHGKVQLNSGGDLQLEQATDSHSVSHAGYDAHARLSGDMSGSNSGSAALGGGQDNGQQSETQAHTAQVRADGGVTLNSAGSLTLQGTEVSSPGDVTLKAGEKLDLRQANSARSQQGSVWSGELSGGASSGSSDSANSRGGSVGAKAKVAMQHEQQSTAQGARVSGANVTLSAGAQDSDALHLQGAQVTGHDVALNAQQGGIVLESASSGQEKNNWGVDASGGLSGRQSVSKDAQGQADPASRQNRHTLNTGLKVAVDRQTQTTQQNSQIHADNQVTLSSQGDTSLAGARVDAQRIGGEVGGDLRLESRQDSERSTQVNAGLTFSHSNDEGASKTAKLSKIATPHLAGKVQSKLEGAIDKVSDKVSDEYNGAVRRLDKRQDTTGSVGFNKANETVTLPETLTGEKPQGALWDRAARSAGNGVKSSLTGAPGAQGSLQAEGKRVDNLAVTQQSGIAGQQGVTLRVNGETDLTGATIESAAGKVDLSGSRVVQRDLAGHRYQGSGKGALPLSVGGLTEVANKLVTQGELPLSVSTESHPESSQSGVHSKQ
ncbi:hemagglutinin repeat-containing protein [Edwardsiella piscicida]|uniref:hemagglutinin repeat-containing protein n=1 Tax=Edwardsiella piscicida TaxID=1263550 RepID=UPI00290D60C7|nr:hemagglutinin repeat-containing protein [Edwardsiella piscicida]